MAESALPKNRLRDPKLNRLLAGLVSQDYDALMGEATVLPLKLYKQLNRQNERIVAVYFPINCTVSIVTSTDGVPQMEMASIGKEGVVGASEALQAQGAIGLYLTQIPGLAVRIDSAAFVKLIRSRPSIEAVIHRHSYALMRQILYEAACNIRHSMEERCARWLLMTRDRTDQDTFPITQEFLSHMLGVRRSTVNVATGALKRAGLIRYVRGQLTILERAGLEAASCKCYQAINAIYQSVLPEA